MRKKTIIIGGVAAGATAAARLRRRDQQMEIVILEKGAYISYANCGLPYYVGDVIKERSALLLQTPEAMKKKFNIDVRVLNEVTEIKLEEKKVIVKNLKNGEIYEEEYDNLLIATGSSPVKPPIEGINRKGIFTLWTVPDTDEIKGFIEKEKPETAVVIGGGFIGLEMAENLHRAGLKVTLVEMQDQVMAPLDFEMAQLLHENMDFNGVQLLLGDGVKRFEGEDGIIRIQLSSGKMLSADMVILSIGVRPNSSLAGKAGLKLNQRGGIVVDPYMRTSDASVYAAGDVVEVQQYVTKEKTLIPLAGPANKQGRICADNIAGEEKTYEGSLGTAVAKVFDLTAASVGVNEKALKAQGKEKGKDYEAFVINQKSHAGYYPKASVLTLKLIFDRQGAILGAQAVGQEGVDKRIDTIAVTMRLKGTIHDLAKLELAYAPPYSSAKDPVNMAGYVAENILDGMVSFATCEEVDAWLTEQNEDVVILDVTEEVERMVFALPGSVHIPLGQLRKRIQELDTGKLIVVYCAVGVRSYNAARILMEHGFSRVKVLEGGTALYKSQHFNSMRPAMEPEKMSKPVPKAGNAGKEENIMAASVDKEFKILDCSGLQCPGPIMQVSKTLEEMEDGQELKVSATDMGFAKDVGAWCRRTGNTLIRAERKDGENIVYIRKGIQDASDGKEAAVPALGQEKTGVQQGIPEVELPQGKTIIVFSGDLDKVLASFIIANGAAAMGRPVTMFFTFWGLNVLRKPKKQRIKKPALDKLFGAMMPRGSRKLKLSRMNMGGMGTRMMKKVMHDKNVNSLEELMKSAMDQGVKLVACTMSMDIMGITKEELIDGVEYAGVASYLGDAEESNVNLFI